jgi:tripartite-type tricarboxylate transporter receptor subunit TctC
MTRLDVLLATALIAALATQAAPAGAHDYPTRPITLIVPFPPGGSATIIARAIADKLGDALGQQIVIDNRGGAGGSIGARQVARSAPDGSTILLAFTGTLAVSPMIFSNVGYDPRKDFAAIGLIGMAPSVLVVHPSVAAHSVAEFARGPDRRRSGLARLRGGAEVGIAGAGGHTARYHRAPKQGARRRARHRGGETTARPRGRRADTRRA